MNIAEDLLICLDIKCSKGVIKLSEHYEHQKLGHIMVNYKDFYKKHGYLGGEERYEKFLDIYDSIHK